MRLAVLVGILAPLAACGGSSDDVDSIPGSYNCAADPRGETYVVGLDHTGEMGAVDFKLMSSTPAPPARDDNSWVVQLSSMSNGVVGSPMVGATLSVSTYMPDHMHGGVKTVHVTDNGDGTYTLDPVNFWMPGYWQTTITVSGTTTDKVVYGFCIAS
ncbi:MAG TPA: FixH family protein [Kofleriaceae bacterium]|jgi:hypothetical protein